MSSGAASKAAALRRAKELGCSGAHQHPNGGWMACETHEEYERLEQEQEEKSVLSKMRDFQGVRDRKGRKKKAKNKKNWEKLGERGVVSIDTISAGLVSGGIGGKAASAIPFDGDEDVFTDINSARRRARQMGCIGVARRRSTGGNTVWTPCSNITDYARRTGSTSLGRRYSDRIDRQRARRILEEEQAKLKKRKLRRKVSLHGELYGKSLRRSIRSAQPFDSNALDGDNDGLVQDSTPFERPAVIRQVGKAIKKVAKPTKKPSKASWENLFTNDPGWYSEAPLEIRKNLSDNAMSKYRELRSGMRSGRVGSGGRAATAAMINKVAPEHRGKPEGARTLHFVGGTTGAGKTSLAEDGTLDIPRSNEAAFVDPDWIKTQLEGWNNGRGAGAVHPASRDVTDRAMDAGREAGTDLIVAGTGKRTEHLDWARRNGYATVGHFVYLPGAEADKRLAARNAKNQAEGGPVLPGWFGSQIAGELKQVVPRQITRGLYDDFYLWNNSVKPPSLIAKRTRDGAFEINDDAAFDDFFSSQGSRFVRDYWENNK
jgi:predicted ABC-type ATPase